MGHASCPRALDIGPGACDDSGHDQLHLDICIARVSLFQLEALLKTCNRFLEVHSEGIQPEQRKKVEPDCDGIK